MAELTTKISVLDIDIVKDLIELLGNNFDRLPTDIQDKLKEILTLKESS